MLSCQLSLMIHIELRLETTLSIRPYSTASWGERKWSRSVSSEIFSRDCPVCSESKRFKVSFRKRISLAWISMVEHLLFSVEQPWPYLPLCDDPSRGSRVTFHFFYQNLLLVLSHFCDNISHWSGTGRHVFS